MGEVIEDARQLFDAPSTKSLFDFLMEEYTQEKTRIEQLASVMQDDGMLSAINHFKRGAKQNAYVDLNHMFELNYALASLNAKYWDKAVSLTDVMDFIPSSKRDEWRDLIHELKTPDFTLENVRDVIGNMLNNRMDYLAEMVDCIFTGLSGEHLTNRPEGFGKRMIIDSVVDCYYSNYSAKKQGLVHDLRSVIAKFRGEPAPVYGDTADIIKEAQLHTGQWLSVDGNAFRIKVYLKGTGHMEINPDISYRLNQILAYLHPMAIPAPHRRRPTKRKVKDFNLLNNLIPEPVASFLRTKLKYTGNDVSFSCQSSVDKHLLQKVRIILESLGAVQVKGAFTFSFDPRQLIQQVSFNRSIPDKYSHQFYPTPSSVVDDMLEQVDLRGKRCLEPSAGLGSIARKMVGCAELTMIEISSLFCDSLTETVDGNTRVLNMDFLKFVGQRFDVILMNSPYSQGRALAHIEHAATLLDQGGTLVAICPPCVAAKLDIEGVSKTQGKLFHDAFEGTQVTVQLVKLQRI